MIPILIAPLLAPLLLVASNRNVASSRQPVVQEIADKIPGSALFYVEGPGLADFLDRGLEHPFVQRLLNSELGRALLAQSPVSAEEALAMGREILGRDPLELASELVSGGVALGIEPKGGKVAATFVAHSGDDLAWEELLESIARRRVGSGLPQPELHGEIEVFRLKQDFLVGLREGLALVATNGELFEESLGLLASEGGSALSAREPWRTAAEGRDDDALIWGWLDLERVRTVGGRMGDLRKLTELGDKPAVHMLLGSGLASLSRAASWSATITIEDDAARVALNGFGIERAADTELAPGAGRGESRVMLPTPTKRELGHAVLYRDFAGVFANRVDLFPADVLPVFAKANTDLGPILGGMDLGEEVLPRISPWLRIVAREVDFDPRATPDLPLPAVCVLVEMEEPDATGEILESGFQTLIAVLNIERAQQGKPSMMLRVAALPGVEDGQVSYAQLLPPGEGDGVDIDYNLVPACARVGSTFLLGTHRALVEELARQVARDELIEVAGDRDHLELFSAPIARALRANFAALVSRGVLVEGKSRAQATQDIGGLVGLVELFGSATLELSLPTDDVVELELRLELAPLEESR